ncbi:uncharacterized protein N7483_009395 [Penicillium malachiteum]|uniref:uncharacterized protein n=1 Tax=Penicillium malachiteum TaxID=1324776 RepID=UPI0025480767|nr:uncharacterized protein N7483_009395 [Penicillium malachiteum]KAJ5721461.1 hypothetical protein N7483_009395 [Penicillium malachiteum]
MEFPNHHYTHSTPTERHVCLSSTQSRSLSPRGHLETLISRHGYPTPVSLSSLRDLTATTSTYNPPSPRPRRYRSDSPPTDAFDSLSLSATTRPIPIPRRAVQVYDDDLPVTPLTGRFDKDDYFDDWERASLSAKSRHILPPSSGRHGRHSSMRSDNSPFYSPVASPTMSPRQPSSPQPSRSSRTQAPAKSVPGFHLGTLPRFHPAVYQPATSSHTTQGQPPSPRQSRQHTYRTASGSARDVKWQYRDLLDGSSQSPSAPRLDPLRSPGPVTPLALESGDYLAAGYVGAERVPRDSSSEHAGPPPDLVEKLIARENEKARQLSRKSAKGR